MLALADDIATLSMEDQERAYSELHCIPDSKVENTHDLQLRLIEFDYHLNKLLLIDRKGKPSSFSSSPASSSTPSMGGVVYTSSDEDTDIDGDETTTSTTIAYRIARRQNKAYVEDPNFRLRFLRCEQYDAEKAANHFLRFFNLKLRLFGKSKLTQDILLQDLGEDGMYTLETGFMQFCPLRDRAGRKVLTIFIPRKKYRTLQTLVRRFSCVLSDD